MYERVDTAFERILRPFLQAHPHLQYEWRTVPGVLGTDRRDLICAPGTATEVFATLRADDAVVGDQTTAEDFQDFGAGTSATDLAHQAFARFVSLLRQHGHLDQAR